MCMKSAKIREGLSDDRQFSCSTRATVTVTKKQISKVDCDTYCEGNGNCDSYIYDSNNKRCIAKPRYMQSSQKVLRQGSRKTGDAFCHVISKFEKAHCPCFNKNDLDSAVDEINNGDVIMDNSSCSTDSDRDGLELAYKPRNSEFPNLLDFGSFPNGCSSEGALQSLGDEEESKRCESLIQDACDALDFPVVPPVTCPCFDESDLALAIGKIKNGTVDMDNRSCSTDSKHYGATLVYSPKNSNYKLLGFGSYSDSCMFEGDTRRGLTNDKEIERCESLIQNACGTLNVPVVPPVTCRCFDKDKLALAVEKINNGTVDMGCNSCSTHSLDGLELTYTPKNSTYYHMLGYGSYGENCMSEGDQLFSLEDDEESKYCESLIQSACDSLAASIVGSCL